MTSQATAKMRALLAAAAKPTEPGCFVCPCGETITNIASAQEHGRRGHVGLNAYDRIQALAPDLAALLCDMAEALEEEHARAVAWETESGAPMAHQEAVEAERYGEWAEDCPACKALAVWAELVKEVPDA